MNPTSARNNPGHPLPSDSPFCRQRFQKQNLPLLVCILLLLAYAGLGARAILRSLDLSAPSTDASNVFMDHFLSAGLGVAQPTQQLRSLLEGIQGEGPILFFGRKDVRSEWMKNLVTSLAQPRRVIPFLQAGEKPPEHPVGCAPAALIFFDVPQPAEVGKGIKLGRLSFVQLGTGTPQLGTGTPPPPPQVHQLGTGTPPLHQLGTGNLQ